MLGFQPHRTSEHNGCLYPKAYQIYNYPKAYQIYNYF